MRELFRLWRSELLRACVLLAGVVAVVTAIEVLISSAAAVSGLLAGRSALESAGTAAGIMLPGAVMTAGLSAHALRRRFPTRPRRVILGAVRALGLRTIFDGQRSLVAAGECRGRAVRVHAIWSFLGPRVTASVEAQTGGYAYFGRDSDEQGGLDRAWAQTLQEDPEVANALAVLVGDGREGVVIAPTQVLMSARWSWLESPEYARDRVLSLLDLAAAAERHPAPAAQAPPGLKRMFAFVPEPGAASPLFALGRGIHTLALGGWWAMALLCLVFGAPMALLDPWMP